MTRTIILPLCAALIFSFSFHACKKEVKETTTVTARNGLVLRSGPGIDAKKITVIPFKAKVGILKYSNKISVIGGKTAPWVRVRYGKNEGWVFSAWLANYAPQEQDDMSRLGIFATAPFAKKYYRQTTASDVKESLEKNIPAKAKIKTEEIKNIHDPSITDKKYTLTYPGVTFTIYHAVKLDKQIMQGIIITGNDLPLKYGIKTGMSKKTLIKKLGEPAQKQKETLIYNTADALPVQIYFTFKKDSLKKILIAYPVE